MQDFTRIADDMNPMTPEQAWRYIETFSKHTMPGTDRVTFADGTEIIFATMTDADAIRVAKGLLDMEAEAASRSTRNM